MSVQIFTFLSGRVMDVEVSSETSERFFKVKLRLKITTNELMQSVWECNNYPTRITEAQVIHYLDIFDQEGGSGLPLAVLKTAETVTVLRKKLKPQR